MTRIEPYDSLSNALADLDNGGRLLSFTAHADDDRIDASELAKAAGVIGGKQQMFLFFDMSIARLGDDDATQVRSLLSDKLSRGYEKQGPHHGTAVEIAANGEAGDSWIITGRPHLVGDTSQLSMFIFVPISAGKTTVMMPIPIIEHYEVYEMRDERSGVSVRIAHTRGEEQLPDDSTRVGGVLKQSSSDGKGVNGGLYLEAIYYTSPTE